MNNYTEIQKDGKVLGYKARVIATKKMSGVGGGKSRDSRIAELEAENNFLFGAALGCCDQEWLREELWKLKKMAGDL